MISWRGWTDALWVGLLSLYILAGARAVPFHGDESTLVYMGRDYHYLFVDGDLARLRYDPHWRVSPAEQHLRLLNGTISKTVYGAVAHGMGYAAHDLNEQWRWGRDYDWNARRGRIPESDLLVRSRLASSAQLAAAAACFFLLVRMTVGRPTAWLAVALFTLHPNMLINGRRAMMEGSHILGLTLVLLAAAWLLQGRNWRRIALLGICGGVAMAAKHPNLVACVCALFACAVMPALNLLRTRDTRALRELARMALAGLLTLAVFLLLNPAWWNAPAKLPALVLEMRAELMQGQINAFGGYEDFAAQLSGFFEFVFMGVRQYFEVDHWTTYAPITAQIDAYESSGLAGALVIGGSGRLGLACLLLSLVGIVALCRDKSALMEHRLLLLAWMLGTALFTLTATPLPWARYYLPLLPALMILVSQALVTLTRWLWRSSRNHGFALLA